MTVNKRRAVVMRQDKLPLPVFEPGSVWLVGAGPGDPGLLTALALHALAHADVVVHDALVEPAVLALARPAVPRVFVGKRGGLPSARQTAINDILTTRARRGERVLRLKGGDPFVFGRGGEEALALSQAGVPFRVVPGVTAAIGGLAYAGIPATHRGLGGAVTLVTGHGQTGGLPEDLDWAALAASATIVCYMALGTLPELAGRLLAAGRSPATPVALVSDATTPRQRVIATDLGGCTLAARRRGVRAPAIVAIGPVVALHPLLDWFVPPDAPVESQPVESQPVESQPVESQRAAPRRAAAG
jgi:uroporphyrin-III C-methyltransferase